MESTGVYWECVYWAMVEALIAGERDPAVLAAMDLGRMRPKIPALLDALVGRFAAHHGAVARVILDRVDFLDAAIARLDEEVAARLGPFRVAVDLLQTIPGVGRTVAEVIVAETGADMSRFPSPAHLAAWAGVAPANHESAGKRRPAGTGHGGAWLKRALVEAAESAGHSKGSYLSVQYRQIAARRGPNRATVAVALPSSWPPGTCSRPARPTKTSGPTTSPAAAITKPEARRLVKRLEALGLTVTLASAA